jgi:hypothetical protein
MNEMSPYQESDADRRIADWLETGPNALSDTTSRAIRVAIHTAPRKRGGNAPWRYLSMPVTRIALGATLIGVVLFGGFVAFRPISQSPGASPAPCDTSASLPAPGASATSSTSSAAPASPAPSPADTSTWVRFTSSRYGYSMCVPPDWTITPGTAPWVIGTDGGNDTMDVFDEPAPGTASFDVTSAPLPPGMTDDQWFASYSSPTAAASVGYPPECWPDRPNWGTGTIDGHPAAIHGGLPQCNFTEAAVIVGGRVYTIGGTPDPTLIVERVFDWGQFYAFLDTVKLDPAAADDSPVASPAASPS